jgi:hypothetical protein
VIKIIYSPTNDGGQPIVAYLRTSEDTDSTFLLNFRFYLQIHTSLQCSRAESKYNSLILDATDYEKRFF